MLSDLSQEEKEVVFILRELRQKIEQEVSGSDRFLTKQQMERLWEESLEKTKAQMYRLTERTMEEAMRGIHARCWKVSCHEEGCPLRNTFPQPPEPEEDAPASAPDSCPSFGPEGEEKGEGKGQEG